MIKYHNKKVIKYYFNKVINNSNKIYYIKEGSTTIVNNKSSLKYYN